MHATRRYSHNVFGQRVSWEHLHALVFTREGMVARMEVVPVSMAPIVAGAGAHRANPTLADHIGFCVAKVQNDD